MTKYTNLQITLHWVIFVLIAFQYIFHEPIAQAFDLRVEGKEFNRSILIPMHLVFGGLVFLLLWPRLWARIKYGSPEFPDENSRVLRYISKFVHWSFYLVLFLLPITGAAAWFNLSIGAGKAHEALRGILIILVQLHIGGALFHYFMQKKDIFKRMRW